MTVSIHVPMINVWGSSYCLVHVYYYTVKRRVQLLAKYSQLLPCGHSAITDTPLLRKGAKSPAKTTKKCMEITLAIQCGLSL